MTPFPEPEDFALLKGLIEVPSVSRFERPAVEWLRERAQALGLSAAVDDTGSFTAATSGDPLRSDPSVRDIVLLGHIDTVPGYVPVRVEGDNLFGRGSVDAKGPLAAFVAAAAGLRGALPAGWRVVVVGAVEEEIATSRGARGAVSRYSPDACIIGEPSGWDAVTLGYKGRVLLRVTLGRSVAHTAGPGLSVLDEIHGWWAGVLTRVAELNQGRQGAFGTVQATLRSLHSGGDGLVDRAEAVGGFRLPPGVSPHDLEHLGRECLPEGARLEAVGPEVAFLQDRHAPIVRAFTTTLRAAGAAPRLLTKTGTADMNVVGPIWGARGCPIVAYGAGDSALDHTPHEHVSIPEWRRSVAVLRGVLTALTAAPAAHIEPKPEPAADPR